MDQLGKPVLDSLLRPSADDAVVVAGSLVAGDWIVDGPSVPRTGPYVRRTVSAARIAAPGDPARAGAYAADAARTIARLAPATRADVLSAASALATRHRDDFARLIALELGKPLKDGLGEMDRVADTFAV